jgi:hypothetical protein
MHSPRLEFVDPVTDSKSDAATFGSILLAIAVGVIAYTAHQAILSGTSHMTVLARPNQDVQYYSQPTPAPRTGNREAPLAQINDSVQEVDPTIQLPTVKLDIGAIKPVDIVVPSEEPARLPVGEWDAFVGNFSGTLVVASHQGDTTTAILVLPTQSLGTVAESLVVSRDVDGNIRLLGMSHRWLKTPSSFAKLLTALRGRHLYSPDVFVIVNWRGEPQMSGLMVDAQGTKTVFRFVRHLRRQ